MNEQNRYRGNVWQQRPNEGRNSDWDRDDEDLSDDRGSDAAQRGAPDRGPSQWERDYGQRQRNPGREPPNPDYPRRGGNEYPHRNASWSERGPSAGEYGTNDGPFREQDRDDRGGSSGYGPTRDYHQPQWGSMGGQGREYDQDRGSFAARGPSEIPWGERGNYFHENRGARGPAYGRSRNPNSIANFGTRTREEANYYSGSQAQSFSGRGPKGYARSDERIREDVSERLSENDDVDASDIEVTVANREVTLSGTVETRRMKHIAEDLADSVSGVEDVHNRIRVRKPLLKEMADKIMGEEPVQHHANGGTKTTAPSTSGSSVNGRT